MKTIFLVLIIGMFAAAGFWYVTENNRADRAEAYKRQQEENAKREAEEKERLLRQKEEDERVRRERTEAMAKEDAVQLFLNYIAREEDRLTEEIEIAKIALEKMDIDQNSLSEELQAIESANAARVASAEKRQEKHRDKVERVSALLQSMTMNRLALTYCGEDLSLLRSKFDAEVQRIKSVDDQYRERIKSNRRKYNETIADADENVSRKLKAARAKYDAYAKSVDANRIPNLKKQLANIEREIQKIIAKKSQSNWDRRNLENLQRQQILLQNQISQFEDIGGLASADLAHFEATDAETEARRKFDAAGVALTMENDEALLDRDHEQDVYNTALLFENLSVDKILQAIKNARQLRLTDLARAEKQLSFLRKQSVNMDFMTAQEVEEMRRRVAKTIGEEIIEGVSK